MNELIMNLTIYHEIKIAIGFQQPSKSSQHVSDDDGKDRDINRFFSLIKKEKSILNPN